MRTARFSDSGGGLPTETPTGSNIVPLTEPPNPRRNIGSGIHTPLKGTWDQAARQKVTSYRDPTLDRPVKTLPHPKLHFRAVNMIDIFIVAYKVTYGDVDVWVPYRRNFKGHFPPPKTRKTCIVSTKCIYFELSSLQRARR